MKYKKIFFLIMIIILFTVPKLECKADGTANDINYEITYFKINKAGKMTMKGWSFIDHMDNYGGKNLNTFIVAYTGDWNDNYIHKDYCKNNNKPCIRYKTNQGGIKINKSTIDMYYVRCTNSACSSGKNSNRKTEIENRDKYAGDIDTCTGSGDYGGSHCLYYDLGFEVTIPISDFEKIIEDKNTEVKFKIVSRVVYKNGNSTADEWQFSSLGILPAVCSRVYEINCKNQPPKQKYSSPKLTTNKVCDANNNCTWDVNWTEVTLGGMEKKIHFTAIGARQFLTNTPKGGSYGNFRENHDYNVIQYGSMQTYNNYKGDGSGTFKARMLKLEGGYWAFTSWVKAAGNLTISLENKSKKTNDSSGGGGGGGGGDDEKPCGDFYCIGGNCDYAEDSCSSIDPAGIVDVSCDGVKKFNSCVDNYNFANESSNPMYVSNCGKQLLSTNEYYYKVSKKYIQDKFNNYTNIITNTTPILEQNEGGTIYYYFPIKFFANVKLYQYLKFKHSNFTNNQKINGGRFFQYSFDYTVSSDWYNEDYSELIPDTLTSSNNTYNRIIETSALLNSTQVNFDVILGLKKGETIYQREGTSLNFTAVPYDENFYIKLASNKVTQFYTEEKIKNLNVKFDDSNDKKSKKSIEPGTVSCQAREDYSSKIWEPGEPMGNVNARTLDCKYTINTAYFKNNGIDYGNYTYSDIPPSSDYSKTKNGDSIYYIPMDATDVFQFSISAENLSLLTPITYEINTTCNVIPRPFPPPPPGDEENKSAVRYRPIDETNPFPKGEIPINWKSYVVENGLNRITEKSFAHIYYQTKRNIDSVDDETYGNYSSHKDISTDGHSSFIINKFFNYFDNKFHCKAGTFDPTCDEPIN